MAGDEAMLNEDARTLRLAAPGVDADRLDRLVRYHQAWLDAARGAVTGLDRDATFAAAHRAGLAASGLDVRTVSEMESMVRDFCGRRWTDRELIEKAAALEARLAEAKARGVAPAPRDVDALAALRERTPFAAVRAKLVRRYGEEAVALMEAREEALLPLHRGAEDFRRRAG